MRSHVCVVFLLSFFIVFCYCVTLRCVCRMLLVDLNLAVCERSWFWTDFGFTFDCLGIHLSSNWLKYFVQVSWTRVNSYTQNAGQTQDKRKALLESHPDEKLSFRWRSSLRLSLKDILNAVDTGAEFAWRKKLWFEIGKTEVEETLKNCSSNCLLPFFKSCGKEGFESQILEVLDQGTCNCRLLAIHIFSTPGFFEREAKKKLERQKKKETREKKMAAWKVEN